jgi:hypothetical protein
MAAASSRRASEEAPFHALARIAKELEGGRIAPVYVLRGEERYFRARIADAVARAASERGLEVCRHDVKHPEFSIARLLDDLEGRALFATGRCVLVHEVGALLVKNSKTYSAAAAELLRARMKTGDGGTLVLAAESLRADHALVKAARELGGELVACRRLWEGPPPRSHDPRAAELVRWLIERAKTLGVQVSPDAAVFLAEVTGNDLFALEGQLERVRQRGSAGLRELVDWQAGASPYEVAEALILGELESAVVGVEALFRGGFAGRGGARTIDPDGLSKILLGALYGKVREAMHGARLIEGGASPARAAELCGVRTSWAKAAESFRARLHARGAREWRSLLAEVAALDRRQHRGAHLGATDFSLLALRWRKRSPAAGSRPVPARGRR